MVATNDDLLIELQKQTKQLKIIKSILKTNNGTLQTDEELNL